MIYIALKNKISQFTVNKLNANRNADEMESVTRTSYVLGYCLLFLPTVQNLFFPIYKLAKIFQRIYISAGIDQTTGPAMSSPHNYRSVV
jgi:hypothetical protein